MWPGERAARRKRRENERSIYRDRSTHPQSTLHNRERRGRRRSRASALNELLGHIFSYLPATRSHHTRFAWGRADKMPPAT